MRIRNILVERGDNVVAVPISAGPKIVLLESIRFCEPHQIQPESACPLSVARIIEKFIDEPFVAALVLCALPFCALPFRRIARWTRKILLQLVERRGDTEQIQIEPTDQNRFVGVLTETQTLGLQFLGNECIDGVDVTQRRHGRIAQRLKEPILPVHLADLVSVRRDR